jgi:hypothetical protein
MMTHETANAGCSEEVEPFRKEKAKSYPQSVRQGGVICWEKASK